MTISVNNSETGTKVQNPIIVKSCPQSARKLSFKAEPDRFERQASVNFKANGEKKVKTRDILNIAVSVSSIALAGAIIYSIFGRRGGTAAEEAIIKEIREKMTKVKDPAIREQIRQELAMAPHERNLTRAENLIKLDQLNQTKQPMKGAKIGELRERLDSRIIGMRSAKDEMIGFNKTRNFNIEHGISDGKPTILVLDGSPGTSKTTLAKDYADANGMYFKKIPCGGIGDAQEIVGFKRTYVGSIPGSIAQAQIESGSKNVCYCLDEIDRVTKKEILDSLLAPFDDQALFVDQYYNSAIDLSQSTFILTTNDFTKLPEALKNRVRVIHIEDFTPKEKAQIAELKLKNMIENQPIEKYIDGISPEVYDEIVSRTNDKGGRQVTQLVQELINKIKHRQQDGLVTDTRKVKIDKKFLEEIKLGDDMIKTAKLEAERNNPEWRLNNL